MKKYLIILCIIFTGYSNAQIKGETKPGRVLVKKETVNEKKNTPEIYLTQPILPANKEIFFDEKNLTIKGTVTDDLGVKEISVNGSPVKNIEGNHFAYNMPLKDGANYINIRAVNNEGKFTDLNFTVRSGKDKIGPSITVLEPAVTRGIKVVRKSEVTTIKGTATDPSGVVKVTVNNQTAEINDEGEFTVDIYLDMGDNKITVEAFDGRLNSTKNVFTITRELSDVINAGKYIGLFIGINSYEGYWPPLKNAVNDAKELAKTLKEKYHFDEVYTLLDKDATRRNIIQKFEELTTKISRDDNVLIFYAGHGQFNKNLNRGYWVPVDAKTNSIADYISNNDIKTFIGGIPSKHTLLITDACFAGDVFRGNASTSTIPFDPANMERYYQEVYKKQSRLALTSGGVEEVMDGGKGNHSIFTYYLLKALEDNNKKYMDIGQLFTEFKVAVTNNSEQTPMLQTVRDTDDEGGQFIFIKKQ